MAVTIPGDLDRRIVSGMPRRRIILGFAFLATVAQYVLSQPLFGVPWRMLFAAAAIAATVAPSLPGWRIPRRALRLLLPYFVLVASVAIGAVSNGAGAWDLASLIFVVHGPGVAVFLAVIQAGLPLTVGRFASRITVLLIVAYLVLSLGQAVGSPAAWDVWRQLHPSQVDAFFDFTLQQEPGPFFSAFSVSYVMPFLCCLLIAGHAAGGRLRRLLVAVAMIASTLVSQERSLVVGLVVFGLAYAAGRRGSSGGSAARHPGRAVAIVAGYLAALAAVMPLTLGALSGSRLGDFGDAARVEAFTNAVDIVIERPLFGYGPDLVADDGAGGSSVPDSGFATEARLARLPHNAVVNAALYGGMVGVVALVILMVRVLRIASRLIRSPATMAFGAALILYLVNTMFHNGSFVTGDVIPWFIVAATYPHGRP